MENNRQTEQESWDRKTAYEKGLKEGIDQGVWLMIGVGAAVYCVIEWLG
jgi:hypothetical protein